MSLIYTNTTSKKRKKTKKQRALEEEHAAFVRAMGYTGSKKKSKQSLKRTPQTSMVNNIPSENTFAPCFKKEVDSWKWKKDRKESQETINEIERKKTQIAPAYNKGGYQYITEGTDPSDLGRKK